jgi:hypothetical protein
MTACHNHRREGCDGKTDRLQPVGTNARPCLSCRASPASRSWPSFRCATSESLFYDANGSILQAPVSSGQKGRETPAGIFSIIEKQAEHYFQNI